MTQAFITPQKGGNICNKFVFTKQKREYLYNTIVDERNALLATLNRAALTYSHVVAGIGEALVKSNTGWKIDSDFIGENNKIEPATTIPSIESVTSESNTEIWSYDIPSPIIKEGTITYSDSANTVSCMCTDDEDKVFFCTSFRDINSADGDYALLISCYQNDEIIAGTQLSLSDRKFYKIDNTKPVIIIPIACGINANNEIKVFVKCKNCVDTLNNILDIGIFEWKLEGRNFTLLHSGVINTTPNIDISKDNNQLPIVSACYQKYTDVIGYAYLALISEEPKIYCSTGGSEYEYTLEPNNQYDYIKLLCSNNSWFLMYINNFGSGNNLYLTINYGTSNQLSQQKNFELDIQTNAILYNILDCCFDKNFVTISCLYHQRPVSGGDHINIEIFDFATGHKEVQTALFDYLPASLFNFYKDMTLCTGRKYIYILSGYDTASKRAAIFAINLDSKQLLPYSITIPGNRLTSGVYNKGLYIGAIGINNDNNSDNYIHIDNYIITPIELGTRTPANAPLTALINLTHLSGAKLQISCNNSMEASQLFDNNGNYLYRSDIGFCYISRNYKEYSLSTSSIDLEQPSWHIDGNNLNPLLYNEAANYTQNHTLTYNYDLEYYITSSQDGNFVDLMVKTTGNNPAVVANIGCGDLIENLQYPLTDNSPQAHTLYFALGFVQPSLINIPTVVDTDKLTVAFVGPIYEDFRFYGGVNADTNKDLIFTCKSLGYEYDATALIIGDCVYTMPINIGIFGSNPAYYFNSLSGFKGTINRAYLAQIRPTENSADNRGHVLDNGNYINVGFTWAIGWDSKNTIDKNPYATEE